MYILENVPLAAYSTMRLGGKADYLVEVTSRQEIAEAVAWAEDRGLRLVMVGGGSNIFWWDDGYSGLVIVNRLSGFEQFDGDPESAYFTFGAGENWDSVVGRTVELGFSGIEQLSLIPGTAGATPIQNVGAYGREIKDVLMTVEALDRQSGKFVTLRASDCGLAYRTSRFKTTDRGRFFISAVTVRLTRRPPSPPFYPAVTRYFEERGITQFTPAAVREAVIYIRSSRLPDVNKVANNGSFFYNPIISENKFEQIRGFYPDIVSWPMPDGRIKLSAAWLVERAGFKDFHDPETGIGTWPSQPLVLVNEHATKTADLLRTKEKIVQAVEDKFGLTLEQEPELIA